jgi:catechol 2,3-dioxygenase-like lactoylglutathione lyase family enzyme
MSTSVGIPHFAQVAVSTPDMARSLQFEYNVLGYRNAGGRYTAGAGLGAVQGLPGEPACICWWLVNDQPYYQLEIFQYAAPAPNPRPVGWRPSDIGYGRLTYHVRDLDAAVAAARACGAPVLAEPAVVAGARRACVVDPTGTPTELVEDPAVEGPARLAAVGASVPDIARARRYFAATLGLRPLDPPDPARETLWALPGAQRDALALDAGNGVTIELAQYTDPVPRPRPDGWRINDIGILNVALGFRDWQPFGEAWRRVKDAGYRYETAPRGPGGPFDVSYCMDEDGFSVELLYCPESSDLMLGFLPVTSALG